MVISLKPNLSLVLSLISSQSQISRILLDLNKVEMHIPWPKTSPATKTTLKRSNNCTTYHFQDKFRTPRTSTDVAWYTETSHTNRQKTSWTRQQCRKTTRFLRWYFSVNQNSSKVYKLRHHSQRTRISKKTRIIWIFINFRWVKS